MSKRSRSSVDWSQFKLGKKISKRLYGKKRTELRKRVYKEKGPLCYYCGSFAPLYVSGGYSPFLCGDMVHIKSVGAGGDDTLENTVWACHSCHMKRDHSPRFNWNGE